MAKREEVPSLSCLLQLQMKVFDVLGGLQPLEMCLYMWGAMCVKAILRRHGEIFEGSAIPFYNPYAREDNPAW